MHPKTKQTETITYNNVEALTFMAEALTNKKTIMVTQTTSEALERLQKHLQESAKVLALMAAPKERLFDFLRDMHKAEEHNTEATRILHALRQANTTKGQKANIQKAHTLCSDNVFLYAFMDSAKCPVQMFLQYAKRVTDNTAKAMQYITYEIQ